MVKQDFAARGPDDLGNFRARVCCRKGEGGSGWSTWPDRSAIKVKGSDTALWSGNSSRLARRLMVRLSDSAGWKRDYGAAGIEPVDLRAFGDRRSTQLSYTAYAGRGYGRARREIKRPIASICTAKRCIDPFAVTAPTRVGVVKLCTLRRSRSVLARPSLGGNQVTDDKPCVRRAGMCGAVDADDG